VTTREIVTFLICGAGTLAMSLGAFGLLAAINRESRGNSRVVPLIGLYSLGVVLDIAGLVLAGVWYLAVPLALMLVPVDEALRRHGFFRRTADLSNFK
jgi:hypothetical protein